MARFIHTSFRFFANIKDMKNIFTKKWTCLCFIGYLFLIFSYPFLKGSIAYVGGYDSYLEKLVDCINLIPFRFDDTVMSSIIFKNIIFKVFLFIPLGYMLFTLKENVITAIKLVLLIALLKESFHLLILYGYFDITDFIYYLIGGISGFYLHKNIYRYIKNKLIKSSP